MVFNGPRAGVCFNDDAIGGRGFHSSTFQLNLSRSLSLTPRADTEYPTKCAYFEPKSGRV